MCPDHVGFGDLSVPGGCSMRHPPPGTGELLAAEQPGSCSPRSCFPSFSPRGAFGQIKFGKNLSWSCLNSLCKRFKIGQAVPARRQPAGPCNLPVGKQPGTITREPQRRACHHGAGRDPLPPCLPAWPPWGHCRAGSSIRAACGMRATWGH